MAKGKVEKTGAGNWGSFGGDTKMYGFRGTGTQDPGQTASEGTGSKRGIEPKAGGNKAFVSSGTQNKFGAGPQESGQTASHGARQEGFAHGGSTHMFGNRGSRKAIGGQTSQ
jgi:hypothetical protein